MKPLLLTRNGFNLRTIHCKECNQTIIHPSDKQEYEEFMRLKKKDFEVKMRMVGNSYAVSIPREIVDFMQEQENMIDNMVKLSFEEAGRISMRFNTPEEDGSEKRESRVVSSKQIKVIKNGKPVYHAQQFSDSANPKNNKTKIYKAKEEQNDK